MTELQELPGLPDEGLVHPLDVPAARRWWLRAWTVRQMSGWVAVAGLVAAAAAQSGWLMLLALAVWGAGRYVTGRLERAACAFIPATRLDIAGRDTPLMWLLPTLLLRAAAIVAGCVALIDIAPRVLGLVTAAETVVAERFCATLVLALAALGCVEQLIGVVIRWAGRRRVADYVPVAVSVAANIAVIWFAAWHLPAVAFGREWWFTDGLITANVMVVVSLAVPAIVRVVRLVRHLNASTARPASPTDAAPHRRGNSVCTYTDLKGRKRKTLHQVWQYTDLAGAVRLSEGRPEDPAIRRRQRRNAPIGALAGGGVAPLVAGIRIAVTDQVWVGALVVAVGVALIVGSFLWLVRRARTAPTTPGWAAVVASATPVPMTELPRYDNVVNDLENSPPTPPLTAEQQNSVDHADTERNNRRFARTALTLGVALGGWSALLTASDGFQNFAIQLAVTAAVCIGVGVWRVRSIRRIANHAS